jgi:hypothetical protein
LGLLLSNVQKESKIRAGIAKPLIFFDVGIRRRARRQRLCKKTRRDWWAVLTAGGVLPRECRFCRVVVCSRSLGTDHQIDAFVDAVNGLADLSERVGSSTI